MESRPIGPSYLALEWSVLPNPKPTKQEIKPQPPKISPPMKIKNILSIVAATKVHLTSSIFEFHNSERDLYCTSPTGMGFQDDSAVARQAATTPEATLTLRVSPCKAAITVQLAAKTTGALPQTQIDIREGDLKTVNFQIKGHPVSEANIATHGIEAYVNNQYANSQVATGASTTLLPPGYPGEFDIRNRKHHNLGRLPRRQLRLSASNQRPRRQRHLPDH